MFRIARAPPVAGMALASGAGASLIHLGAPLLWALAPVPLLLLLNPPFKRPDQSAPRRVWPLYLVFLSGSVVTQGWTVERSGDCRFGLPEDEEVAIHASLSAPPADGRGELRPLGRGFQGCQGRLRAILPGDALPPGRGMVFWGRWRKTGRRGSGDPEYAGYFRVDSVVAAGSGGSGRGQVPLVRTGFAGWMERLGGGVQLRLAELFPREKGLAGALIWARKEGLDPGLKEAFARSGTAHLLAISGFHVGVVAGLLLLATGALGWPHPFRYLLSSLGVWGYVTAIGLPDAAVRAALILTVLALGRLMGRAVMPLGALATAFLLFLFQDPGSLLRPGFQLSFAGALGLVVGGRELAQRLRWLGPVSGGVAAGIMATLATLPFVAWHFGRVSLVGIPLTLLAAPLVTLAIPGILGSLALSLLHPSLGGFIARGVAVDLACFRELIQWAGDLPFASVWVSRVSVVAGVGGLLGGCLLLVLFRRRRPLVPIWITVAALILAPLPGLFMDRGTVEVVALDVGQGDALLLRSPGGRWVLVDAGPRTQSYDAGARVVLPYLRRRGIPRLELVLLTHPDMDHVGGAPAILQDFQVGGVLDPGVPVGKEVFLDALEAAGAGGIPWRVGAAGDSLNLDGMALRILAPDARGREEAREDANAASLVLELRFGDFSALLMGDAPVSVEERILDRLQPGAVELLKTGHHGSTTSTGPELLARARPRAAVISVARRNRYGHPHPAVLRRLREAGIRVLRTDETGTIVVKARGDGSFRIR